MRARLFIGMMSGTSCDGVDAALVRVRGRGTAMRATVEHLSSVDFPPADRAWVQAIKTQPQTMRTVAEIDGRIAEHYVACAEQLLHQTATRPSAVTALAAHGQTLFHAPPLTYQAFDPTVLACRTGIDVVSDFRRADCAAGGQGAPLVPFGDWVLFRAAVPRLLLNLGGIANLTVLPAGAGLADVGGFDLGPGNCLSDWLMQRRGAGEADGRGVDVGGTLASRGHALDDVAAVVLADAFFDRPGPKSLDTPAMIRLFDDALRARPDATLEDGLATANAIVAAAILRQIDRVAADAGHGAAETYVAGGGVHNRDIMRRLEGVLSPLRTTDALGVPAQAREAAAFALLAAAHVDRCPCYMPRVTGATRPVVLGSFTPAPR